MSQASHLLSRSIVYVLLYYRHPCSARPLQTTREFPTRALQPEGLRADLPTQDFLYYLQGCH